MALITRSLSSDRSRNVELTNTWYFADIDMMANVMKTANPVDTSEQGLYIF